MTTHCTTCLCNLICASGVLMTLLNIACMGTTGVPVFTSNCVFPNAVCIVLGCGESSEVPLTVSNKLKSTQQLLRGCSRYLVITWFMNANTQRKRRSVQGPFSYHTPISTFTYRTACYPERYSVCIESIRTGRRTCLSPAKDEPPPIKQRWRCDSVTL